MRLNKRLKKIADYVEHDDNFIDVGCDHAFLSIYLVLEKNTEKAIAADINEGPLKVAKEHIKEYNLESKIIAKLGNGLEPVEDFINTVIISGMGGITIADIMRNKEHFENIKKIIISPNNEFYIVRKTIIDNGYYIKDETMVKDRSKFYPIIVFEKGARNYSEDELYFGPILLKNRSEEFIEFYNLIRGNMYSYINKLSDVKKREEVTNEIKRLTNILSDNS